MGQFTLIEAVETSTDTDAALWVPSQSECGEVFKTQTLFGRFGLYSP